MRLKAEYYTPVDLLCNLKGCLPLRQNTCSCTTPSLSSLQLNCVLFHPNTSITEEKKYAVLNSKDSGWGLGEDLQDSSRVLALHIHHSEPPTSANYALALTTCSPLIPNKWGLLVTTITTVLSKTLYFLSVLHSRQFAVNCMLQTLVNAFVWFI